MRASALSGGKGPAIPPAELDRIFEPLYLADQRRNYDREHLGFGPVHRQDNCACARRINRCRFDTEGTTFSVRIPRVQ